MIGNEEKNTTTARAATNSELRPAPSLNATETLACRVCLDNNQDESELICPCDCRGTVAYIHSACLERWVDTTHNTKCQICGSYYELEICGWKNTNEWSLPHAFSDNWEDVLDFRCAIAWLFYVTRFLYIQIRYGSEEMNRIIKETLGDGILIQVWWFAFWANAIYYGAIIILIADQWIMENRKYRFKNRTPLQKTTISSNNNDNNVRKELNILSTNNTKSIKS